MAASPLRQKQDHGQAPPGQQQQLPFSLPPPCFSFPPPSSTSIVIVAERARAAALDALARHSYPGAAFFAEQLAALTGLLLIFVPGKKIKKTEEKERQKEKPTTNTHRLKNLRRDPGRRRPARPRPPPLRQPAPRPRRLAAEAAGRNHERNRRPAVQAARCAVPCGARSVGRRPRLPRRRRR